MKSFTKFLIMAHNGKILWSALHPNEMNCYFCWDRLEGTGFDYNSSAIHERLYGLRLKIANFRKPQSSILISNQTRQKPVFNNCLYINRIAE